MRKTSSRLAARLMLAGLLAIAGCAPAETEDRASPGGRSGGTPAVPVAKAVAT